MFHEGTLQSGIARAIQEQKLVGCFVSDNGPESTIWQDDWLQSGWLKSLLEQKAVLLRIEAESTEAGFLSAFCTIEGAPTLVVIQNGQLQEQLGSSVGKDEFINRVRKVLGASPLPGTTAPPAGESQASTPPPQPVAAVAPPPPARIETPPQSNNSPAPQTSSAVAKGKQKATSPAPQPDTSSTKSAQQSAREALRKKKEGEKEELARIKARIEADKAERKAQASARKAERERLAQPSSSTSRQTGSTASRSRGANAKEVHLSVRLFDGQTIRKTFPRDATLQDDVRPWIDEAAAQSVTDDQSPQQKLPPYLFKHLLAPLPSPELSVADEARSLADVDLAPSATLVLIPVKGYTEAYSGGAGGGIVSGAAGSVLGVVGGAFSLAGSAVGYVGGVLGSVLGSGGGAGQQEGGQDAREGQGQQRNQQEGRSLGSSSDGQGIRVRTLADQRSGEDRRGELYNGNQLNFEPRDE